MKNSKGITLIALIITIIVMLILAGVTMNLVINGGLFDQANKASEEMKNKTADEQAEIIAATVKVDKIANPDKSFEDSVKDAMKGTTFEFVEMNSEGNAVIKDKVTERRYIIYEDTYKLERTIRDDRNTKSRRNNITRWRN